MDGHRIVIRKAKRGQRTFKARIRPGRLSVGVHRVTARVVFRTASRTRARTLVLSFQHCARLAVVTPVHRLMRAWLPATAAGRRPRSPLSLRRRARTSGSPRSASVTRWAHANLLAKVRVKPSNNSRSIARLRWQTEDGPPEVYVVLRSRRVERRDVDEDPDPGAAQRPHRVGSATRRSAACTRSTRR